MWGSVAPSHHSYSSGSFPLSLPSGSLLLTWPLQLQLPLGDAFLPGRLWRPPLAAHSTLARPRLSSTFLWFNDQLMALAPQGTVWQEGEGMSPYSA